MMPNYRAIAAATLGLVALTFTAALAQARDAREHSAQEVVEALVERFSRALFAGPSRNSPDGDAAIVVLEGKGLVLKSQLKATPTLRILTSAELVAEQRAVFMIISQVGTQGSNVLIDYDIPNSASYGTVQISDKDGKLVFAARDSFRSSSGSRATYARLYGGVDCRDGSEMARRFNYYVLDRESSKCSVKTFPESPTEWY